MDISQIVARSSPGVQARAVIQAEVERRHIVASDGALMQCVAQAFHIRYGDGDTAHVPGLLTLPGIRVVGLENEYAGSRFVHIRLRAE